MGRTGPEPNPADRLFAPPIPLPLNDGDPRRVGPYRLEARIGAGGMGRVYLARTVGNRPLAVKVVRPEFADDAVFRSRFRQEVAAARRVHGMFTAEVVDADVDGPLPWLATVYVPGPSLHDVVAGHGPLPAPEVRSLAAGLAEALRDIHTAGVVHRDLKPSNVLRASDGPRVIDFGIARAADATTITRTGIAVGSPRFMSPEQVDGRPVTPATDVFALGAVLAFAGTGQPPFGDGATSAVLYRIVHGAPSLDGLPADLRALLAACLDKDPHNRPSIDEILAWPFEADPTVTVDLLPEPVTKSEPPPTVKAPVARTLVDSTVKPTAFLPTKKPAAPASTRRLRRRELSTGLGTIGVLLVLIIAIALSNAINGPHDGSSPTTQPEPADVRRIATLPGNAEVTPLVFSPDGKILAATGAGNVIHLWDAATGTRTASLAGHTTTIHSLAFSSDGRVLASGDVGKSIKWWDVTTHQLITGTDVRYEPDGSSLTHLAVTRDGRTLADVRWPDGSARVWDIGDPQRPARIGWVAVGATACPVSAISPSGEFLANAVCAPSDIRLLVWRLTGDPGNITNLPLTVPIRDMTFSPDKSLLALARADSSGASVALVEGPDYRTVHRMEGSGDNHAVAFSRDGRVLAAAGGGIDLWNVAERAYIHGTGHPIGHTFRPSRPATSVALSHDGHLLAAADDDGTVELWDISDRVTAG